MIKAKVVCDSISEVGVRLTTFEIEYPRIIHSELLTHRMLSRNAASSRAIPFAKMVEKLDGIPSRFGSNVAGMQDNGEHDKGVVFEDNGCSCYDEIEWTVTPEKAWSYAKRDAVKWSKAFADAGYHKQIFNRLTEPFQMMKTVVTATEWENFFWLRDDVAADPTIAELARKMKVSYDRSLPQLVGDGCWHLPYIDVEYGSNNMYYGDDTNQGFLRYSLRDAIKVSAARCAAVSFRNVDYTLEKCLQVYDRLVGDERKHSSALEHQATPMLECNFGRKFETNNPSNPKTWQHGVSHADRNAVLWSGNFKGFIQHRKTLDGENYTGE